MRKQQMGLLLVLWAGCLLCAALSLGEPGYTVHLPADYVQTCSYPVLFLIPDESAGQGPQIEPEKVLEQISAILVVPELNPLENPEVQIQAVMEELDSAYRTLEARGRGIMGTGNGAYLAYAVGLTPDSPFDFIAGIRGNYGEEGNPWYSWYGSVQTRIESLYQRERDIFERKYTYMDAPVEDLYTDMEGSTDDLGLQMILYGTGKKSHEFTVRPGEFTGAFLEESIHRTADRFAQFLYGDSIEASVAVSGSTDAGGYSNKLTVSYSVEFKDADIIDTTEEPVIEIAAWGDGFETEPTEIQGEGHESVIQGTAVIQVPDTAVQGTVRLSLRLRGSVIEAATAPFVRQVETDDAGAFSLADEWHFLYTGGDTIDLKTLRPEDFQSWPAVLPGSGNWTKGYGNISEENVRSSYGPDTFDFFITGNGYYARTFSIPDSFDGEDLILSLGCIDDRCQVYLNGILVGETGMQQGVPTGETTWAVFSYFPLDADLLNRDGENVIAVRAYNDLPFGAGGWYQGPAGLYSREYFESRYGDACNPRFYEETFESRYAAKGISGADAVDNPYLIYLPESYSTSDRRYPTVYLLHPFNSDHTCYRADTVDAILDAGIAQGLFDEVIVVIPNSSEESWWTGIWERMITEELIPHIDSHYRTIRDARFRLTMGCSMGGQGAMAVALRNPDFFSGAASFYGAFSYGGSSNPMVIAEEESADYLRWFSLYFSCGNQDSYGFGIPAIRLHQQLMQEGVPHHFFIENGGHESSFYRPFFGDALQYVRKTMTHSSKEMEDAVSSSLAVSGDSVQVLVHLDSQAALSTGLLCTIPESSYTRNTAPELSLPLTVCFETESGAVKQLCPDGVLSAEQPDLTLEVPIPVEVSSAPSCTVSLVCDLLDRTVPLAEISLRQEN